MKEFTKEQIEKAVMDATQRVIGDNTIQHYLDAVIHFSDNGKRDILNDKVMSNVMSIVVAQTDIIQVVKEALCDLLIDDEENNI